MLRLDFDEVIGDLLIQLTAPNLTGSLEKVGVVFIRRPTFVRPTNSDGIPLRPSYIA
jgi:hypothetical protein